jgi:mannose-6-phosphate isomerase-like protein (cupin superfamily)
MQIVEEEIAQVATVEPPKTFSYNKDNPLWTIAGAIERTELACGRHQYKVDSVQYLLPFDDLFLAGPSGDAWAEKDPRRQDNKNDFQKQNVRGYRLTGTQITRGYAVAGDWTGPFIRLSYTPGVVSPLGDAGDVVRDSSIVCKVKIGSAATVEVIAPYNERSHRYEVELWSYPKADLRTQLGEKGQKALDSGELLVRPDLVRGSLADFQGIDADKRRGSVNRQGSALTLLDTAPDHAMHPIRPLKIELAWGSADRSWWDPRGRQSYVYEFNMPFRGWNAYLGAGISANPHGGVGFLEYRNLFSNYFGYEAARRAAYGQDAPTELSREVSPWSFDANGQKKPAAKTEPFMTVDYMDLHVLHRDTGIGIHRHRDNQEVFMLLSGKGLMLVGDWCTFPGRERSFEVRTMLAGDMTICKPGRLHALLNTLDEDITLFMFGGYD